MTMCRLPTKLADCRVIISLYVMEKKPCLFKDLKIVCSAHVQNFKKIISSAPHEIACKEFCMKIKVQLSLGVNAVFLKNTKVL